VIHGVLDPDVRHTVGRENCVISQYGSIAGTLTARHDSSACVDRGMTVIAFSSKDYGGGAGTDLAPTPPAVALRVRRLTPLECERLQGFPDNHTLITPNTPDSNRYKAIGNSMAVPVIRWIGQRMK
jgi:DNA (cytosine-5)-methyltransferase 1